MHLINLEDCSGIITQSIFVLFCFVCDKMMNSDIMGTSA